MNKQLQTKKSLILILAILIGLIFQAQMPADKTLPTDSATTTIPVTDNAERARINANYGKLPLSFEANVGQTDERVKFTARGAGYGLFLTADEAVLSLQKNEDGAKKGIDNQLAASSVVRMKLNEANRAPQIVGENEQAGKSNYFVGNDQTKWQTGVSHFGRVRYKDVYQGVDEVFYGNQGELEYDLIVAPNADYKQIKLQFDGTRKTEIEAASGDLILTTEDGGEVRQHKPVVYQETADGRQIVEAKYLELNNREIGFQIAGYDQTQPLVIDPTLTYSTYLGGNDEDEGFGIAVDAQGNAYITGQTRSPNFPLRMPFRATFNQSVMAFVTKLNATGDALVYSTYLGGLVADVGNAIAVDAQGNAYVTGFTGSPDFPILNAFQATNRGGFDAFVTKLNPAGNALVYSTFLGGTGSDVGSAIAVDNQGSAYITGQIQSTDFPTANPFQAAHAGGTYDAFVTKFSASGNALVYSTYLGGNDIEQGFGIAVDTQGSAYVTGFTISTNFPTANAFQTINGGGNDTFVTKLNSTGNALAYSTYLGGTSFDQGRAIAVDAQGSAYVTGATSSPNYPTQNAFQATRNNNSIDAFITKLSATGNTLVYSTYLGGGSSDQGLGIALDSQNNAYISGMTQSANFPTRNPVQAAIGGSFDAFVTRFNPAGNALVYSTYFGGSGEDQSLGIAVDAQGGAYITGKTVSTNFPTRTPFQTANGGGTFDAFVTKISDGIIINSTQNRVADFDGDGRADYSFFRPSANSWFYLRSSNNSFGSLQFGLASDKLASADYDGDGKTDIAVWRESSGTFYIFNSATNSVRTEQFGLPGDKLAVGDWDGDGKADLATYRDSAVGSQSYFYYRGSLNNPNGNITYLQWGATGDKPVNGDFDGDGKLDAAVYRGSNQTWYIRQSSNNQVVYQSFGLSTDTFVPADYDGDGKTDVAVFRNGVWYVRQSSDNQVKIVNWGLSSDKPVPADYDGDGKTDFAVFRSGVWYVLQSSNGQIAYGNFGTSGDLPVSIVN